ncbi:WD40-repeat-containing domain protein [Paraphysoderma sedebokerense]|nr:WD40-repeat-containing domain protein [Paraphysoderma sedebokerense]
MDFDLERLSPFIPTFIKTTFHNLIIRFSPAFENQIIAMQPLRPEEILPGSPLQSSFSQKPFQHPKPSSSRRIYQSSSKSLNKPVTFKSSIKSSGYAQAPRTTKFLGVSQHSGTPKRPSSSQSSTSYIHYPSVDLRLISDAKATKLNGAITHIKFNYSGRHLGVASADKVARCLQYHKNSFGTPKPFSGHGNIINHFDWGTASSNYFLSSSVDVVKLWSLDKSEPLLVMNLVDGNFKSSKSVPKSNIGSIKQKTLTSICESRFYYRDKFILISNANSILMYKYHIDKPSLSKSSLSHSIKPNVNTNVYKLVTSFRASSQCMNSFTNLNTTLSPIIISASSDKSIQVWDVNQNKLITERKNTHDRQIHWISCAENNGYDGTEISGHVEFGNRNLFVTVAAADGIKLWDVRSVSCVKRFEGHMNRYASVKAELSRCGRYIATGSEDNQAYIFDVRTGSLFSKVSSPNHNNIVTCVSWHPVLPVLATAGADGNVAICRHI